MIEGFPTRVDAPRPEIFVIDEQNILSPASQTLSDCVNEDSAVTREKILARFETNYIPGLDTERCRKIGHFFSEKGWSTPQIALIDPDTEALELREILKSANFKNNSVEEFFTGLNNEPISSGVFVTGDLIIVHDMRARYLNTIRQYLELYELKIKTDRLDQAIVDKISDHTLHECAHVAGNLAISQAVIKKVDNTYISTDNATAGFITKEMNAAPTIDEKDYYCGPVLDEAWPAYQSSKFLFEQFGISREEEEIEYRFCIFSEIAKPDNPKVYEQNIVGALHSHEAGEIIEKLDTIYPGILTDMHEVADGNKSVYNFISELKKTLPKSIMQNVAIPKYSAWQQAKAQLGL